MAHRLQTLRGSFCAVGRPTKTPLNSVCTTTVTSSADNRRLKVKPVAQNGCPVIPMWMPSHWRITHRKSLNRLTLKIKRRFHSNVSTQTTQLLVSARLLSASDNYYTFRSAIWRYQFLFKILISPIWMCYCAYANRFTRGA